MSSSSRDVDNFLCTSNSCGVDSNPIYVNVYWNTSLAQWDIDVAASSSQLKHARIDTLIEALFHTDYFAQLNQYGVTSVDRWPSLVAGNCGPPPATIDDVPDQISSLLLCLFTGDPRSFLQMLADPQKFPPAALLGRFRADTYNPRAIYNVILPPQTRPSSPSADFCSQHQGWHNSYSPFGPLDPLGLYGVAVTIVPTNKACHSNINTFFTLLTHEMVEAATDVVPGAIFGWKETFDGEIGDFCESDPSNFLFGQVTQYWSNAANGCVTGVALDPPTIVSASVCGTGQAMDFTLTGTFGPRPWDFPIGSPAHRTLFLKAVISDASPRWEAGNAVGLPGNAANGGTPNEVFFGPIYWTQGQGGAPDTIRIGGFDSNYGRTLASGTVARVIPGNTITLSVGSPATGQFAMSTIRAPTGSAITGFAATPSNRSILLVDRLAQISGRVLDTSGCVIDGVQVNLAASGGTLSPGSVPTNDTGHFSSTYIAPSVPGVQMLTATIVGGPTPVTASLTVAVSPEVTSLSPNIGEVAGRPQATILGAGFVSGSTSVEVQPPFTGSPKVAAPVSMVTYGSLQLSIPRSPLPGDGDGIACVDVVVNMVASECLQYRYVVPGKPVLSFTFTSCDSGTVVASVYAADGTPQTVPIRFSATYNAFRNAAGTYVPILTVNTGDLVVVSGTGPIIATNPQPPMLSVTESYPTFSPELCPDLRAIVGGIDPRWAGFNPDQLKPVPIGSCPGPECPDAEPGIAALWLLSEGPARDLGPRVLMSGTSLAAMERKFRVATVGADALQAAIRANPHVGVFGASAKARVNFVGPAITIAAAGGASSDVDRLDAIARINLPLPAGILQRSQFRIVHLTPAGKASAWIERPEAQLGTKGTSLTIATKETGIYALVRLAE